MKTLPSIFLLLALGTSPTLAGPIEDRQAMMKSFAPSLKQATGLARGTIPYDAALAKASMQPLSRAGEKMPSLFPKGSEASEGIKTTASPMIWSDSRGFKAASRKFSTDANVAGKARDATAFAEALKKVQADCASCHKTYRVPL